MSVFESVLYNMYLVQVGRLDDARKVVGRLWGMSEVEKSIEEIKSVVENDGAESSWLDLLEEPHKRGCRSICPYTYFSHSLCFDMNMAGLAIGYAGLITSGPNISLLILSCVN